MPFVNPLVQHIPAAHREPMGRMDIMKFCSTFRVLALGMAAFAGLHASEASAQQKNCIDVLAGNKQFSRFVNGIVHTHLSNQMRNANEITIFAPTNDAVGHINQVLLDRLFPMEEGNSRQADPVLAPAAVGAHIVQGKHSREQLRHGANFTTVSGTPLSVQATGDTLRVQGAGGTEARVTQADIQCSNGVIHAIDAPLLR
nr:fasciclin domain-containing protein [Pseudoroseomonas coralli]